MPADTPILDVRSAADFAIELSTAQPAFVPELPPLAQGVTTALAQILARFASIVGQRLNQAPNLDKLAFLDMLGINLIPAHPARAPLVFAPLPLATDSHIPAGTRAGANQPGITAPTVFETETDIAITAAALKQVVSLWPDRDAYADHSADLAGGRPFTLFQSLSPVDHVLYLSHQKLLAFKGKSSVEVRFSLSPSGSKALTFRWEFWDGQTWRSFRDFDASSYNASQDETFGLTSSGVVTLKADCGDSEATSVSNISNYWIRARLTSAIPPDPSRIFAVTNQITLRTTIDRSLTHGPGTCQGVVNLDAAYAGNTTLDLTKTFYPLGKAPSLDSAFYFISQEIFNKVGAAVTICIDREKTPEEEADAFGPDYAAAITAAQNDLVASVKQLAASAIASANSLTGFYPENITDVQNATTALQSALGSLTEVSGIPALAKALGDLLTAAGHVGDAEFTAAHGAPGGTATIKLSTAAELTVEQARNDSVSSLSKTYDALSKITAIGAAGAGGVPPPTLSPPRLVWEYFNGFDWVTLLGPVNDDPTNFLKSGEVLFTVPAGISPFLLNGSMALGMRARLSSGSYNRLELITWTDPSSGQTNVIPLILPRPPVLKAIAIGYTYRSPWLPPDQSLTWNDFQVESHTPTATRAAAPYSPFHPVSDAVPALYLGFNRPLPNDYLSMFFNLVENDTDGPPLVWESWSAGQWQNLAVSDDTGALARAGMVAFLAPGVPARAQANINSAAGLLVTANNALAAAVFAPGDRIVVQPDNAAEVVTVDSIDGANVNLVTPLAGTYKASIAEEAALPRFGSSLDWVRARLKADGPPFASQVNGIYSNAVWARQVQTITGETLGSGTGQPNQSFTFRQFPVLAGEQVQVRELDGPQANVGFLVLQEQLLAQGFTATDIRTVTDSRTGLITEVWVTWRQQPNFYFSGPDDRHYVLDRASGRIFFGNGMQATLPTPGNSNIQAYWYQAGGGLIGNVNAGAINQLLSGATASGVTNPAAAEGGADTESIVDVNWRGPQVLRHRGAALSAADYEALALEASPGVAITRCLPATSANLRPAPGWVTLILVPHSLDPQPQPSYELKQEVIAYLAARAPASIEPGRIAVIPPDYLPVGASVTIAAQQISLSGLVKAAALAALNRFFHPLLGGPDGRGWPFGRDVYLSDVARLLEGLDGVNYVRQLELLLNLIPAGDSVVVPPNRLVAAGPMLVVMEGAPNA